MGIKMLVKPGRASARGGQDLWSLRGLRQPSALPRGPAHKGLKSLKRFINLPLDSSRCPGEKGRACVIRKKCSGSN